MDANKKHKHGNRIIKGLITIVFLSIVFSAFMPKTTPIFTPKQIIISIILTSVIAYTTGFIIDVIWMLITLRNKIN